MNGSIRVLKYYPVRKSDYYLIRTIGGTKWDCVKHWFRQA